MAENYERIYICVDDTDDLTKSTSTGSIAEAIASAVEEEFGAKVNMGITRHQLFLDDSVPYTSHNSSMCFDVMLPAGAAVRVDEIGWEKINAMRAASANPGLCILTVPGEIGGAAGSDAAADEAFSASDARLKMAYAALIRYGWEAKERYITPEEAVEIAQSFPGIILKWDGETGQGRVGALAGVALRISGNDGRFRGKLRLASLLGKTVLTVQECGDLSEEKLGVRPAFTDVKGDPLDPRQKVLISDEVKPILRDGVITFQCSPDPEDETFWRLHTKDELRDGKPKKKKNGFKHKQCPYFEPDPDEEERFNEKRACTCGSCLYRRLTADGYLCSEGHEIDRM